MRRELPHAWRDGGVVPLDDDTAPGPGCYTTGLWTGREIRWSTPIVERLARDARALGYGEVATLRCASGMHALGATSFGDAEGIVRFEARPGEDGAATVIGTARPLGHHAAAARTGATKTVHPGPHEKAPGAKIPRPEIDAARREREDRGLDEVFFFDAQGFLVEGSRCNVLLALADGSWAAPPRRRGGVCGVALELSLARVPEIVERDLRREDMENAREILLTNGARGAFAVAEFEGRRFPVEEPGPFLMRLGAAFVD